MNFKWNRNLGQERAVDILVCDPDDLTVLVVEGSKHMRDIDNLAALIGELAGQRSSRRRIQVLIFDLDHRICRGGDEC